MSRHLGSLVLTAALLLTAGCSDEDPPTPEPTGAATPDPTPTATAPSEPTEPPASTGTPEPTVSPASGPLLRQEHLSLHAPEGWVVTEENDTITGFAQDETLLSTVMIGEVEDLSPGAPVDLDEMARDSVENGAYLRDPEILEPHEIAGVLWFHTSGQIDDAHYEDAFGTITDGVLLEITVTSLVEILSPREHQELVDSILASVELDS